MGMITMGMIKNAAIVAALLWAMPVLGQTAQDKQQPAPAPPPATQASPGTTGNGPMGGGASTMGSNMMGGAMTGQGQAGPGSMMPMTQMMATMMGAKFGADHLEGRLAFIKTELKITDAQIPQWNALADAIRSNVDSMAEIQKSMTGGSPTTLLERLAREDKMETAHLAALKKTEETVARLYAVLADDQKKVADTIVVGPMGMLMGMM
jgi:hypothetical protein